MEDDRSSKEPQRRPCAPPVLHKPRREFSDLRPEQVIPYVDDGPCDPGVAGEFDGPN